MRIDNMQNFYDILKGISEYSKASAFSWNEKDTLKKVSFEHFFDDVKTVMTMMKGIRDNVENVILLSQKNYLWFVYFFSIVCAGKNVILLCNYDKAVEYNNLFQADLVIYDEKKGKQAKDIQKECPNMQACTMLETEFLTRKPADFVAGGRIIIYTSGTSCEKKPVILSQENFVYSVSKTLEEFSYWEKSRFVSFLPCDHVFDLVVSMYALLIGSEQHILKRLNAWNECNDYKPDVVAMVPLMINELVSANVQNGTLSFFKEIKVIVTGGAALDNTIHNMLVDSGYKILQGYGCTECPIIAINCSESGLPANGGKRLRGSAIKVVDGQIYVKSQAVCMDYWGTLQVKKEEGWLNTQDLGYYDEKSENVYIMGRAKNCIVLSNGYNVCPEQIEQRLEACKYIKVAVIYQKKIKNKDFLYADIYPTCPLLGGQERAEIEMWVQKINDTLPIYMKIQGYILKYDTCELNNMGKKTLVMRYRKNGK